MKQTATRRKLTALVGAALLAVLAFSGAAWAATTLAVTKTVPAGGATEVSRTANVKAYFNHDMRASTVTSSTFKIRKQGTTTWLGATRSVNNTISPTSTNGSSQSVVTLNPNADLALNTTYQVMIVGGGSGVKDVNGNALGANKSWTFTTVTPPNTTIDPNTGPTGTVASTSASFSFSSSKPNSTFQCSLDGSTFAACTSPKSYSGLSQGSHNFRVRAIDASGLTDQTAASRNWTVDTVAPNTSIIDKPKDPSNNASPSFSFSSNEAGSTFECKLDNEASYSACNSPKALSTLSDGSHTFSVRAKDVVGNVDQSPASYTWTVDTTAPTVNNLSPADAAAGVASTTNVTATFSEAMNSSSISSQTFTLKQQGSTSQLGAAVSYDSTAKKATLDPSTDLAPNTTYTATLTTGVKDAAGNTLGQELSWTFTTDIVRPTVVSYAPQSAAALSTNVAATFSVSMDPNSITNQSFTLTRQGSTSPVAAQVTYDSASKTATLNPDSDLSDNSFYTAVIKSGSTGAKDLQGNGLAQDFSWTFSACSSGGGIILSSPSIERGIVFPCG
jgi:hypothetical protein